MAGTPASFQSEGDISDDAINGFDFGLGGLGIDAPKPKPLFSNESQNLTSSSASQKTAADKYEMVG